jgi:hypothetical protein
MRITISSGDKLIPTVVLPEAPTTTTTVNRSFRASREKRPDRWVRAGGSRREVRA